HRGLEERARAREGRRGLFRRQGRTHAAGARGGTGVGRVRHPCQCAASERCVRYGHLDARCSGGAREGIRHGRGDVPPSQSAAGRSDLGGRSGAGRGTHGTSLREDHGCADSRRRRKRPRCLAAFLAPRACAELRFLIMRLITTVLVSLLLMAMVVPSFTSTSPVKAPICAACGKPITGPSFSTKGAI